MLEAGQVSRDSMKKVAQALGSGPMTPEERVRQIDNDFGLVVIASGGRKARKFPLNTAFDTFMSKTAFVMNQKSLPEQARKIASLRISAAARRYSLPVVEGLEKKAFVTPSNIFVLSPQQEAKLELAHMAKTASDAKYAISRSIDGEPMAQYPIDTPERIKMRIDQFEKIASDMHIKYAFQYADNVYARAQEEGVPVPEDSKLFLYKQANLNPLFRSAIAARTKIAPDEVVKNYLNVMCKTASSGDARQAAIAIDAIDRSCGMEMLYGKAFPDAAESVLTTTKRANVIEVGTLEVNTDEIRDAIDKNPETFKNIVDDETLQALRDNTEVVFKSLPLPYQQMIIHSVGNDVS